MRDADRAGQRWNQHPCYMWCEGHSTARCVRRVLTVGTRVTRRNAGTALGGRGDVRALLESRGGGGGLEAAGGGARRAAFASAARPGQLLAVNPLKHRREL